MSEPLDEQKILGKTLAERTAESHARAHEAINGVDPRAVVMDAGTVEQAARRMFELDVANTPDASLFSWEGQTHSHDMYRASVRFAAEEVIGLQRPEDFRGFVSGWIAHARDASQNLGDLPA
jgi:hypothetical protein